PAPQLAGAKARLEADPSPGGQPGRLGLLVVEPDAPRRRGQEHALLETGLRVPSQVPVAGQPGHPSEPAHELGEVLDAVEVPDGGEERIGLRTAGAQTDGPPRRGLVGGDQPVVENGERIGPQRLPEDERAAQRGPRPFRDVARPAVVTMNVAVIGGGWTPKAL